MSNGKRWTVQDRDGNPIYLSEERWQHIIADENHPEMAGFEELLKTAIRQGRRKQEPLNARKYRYSLAMDELPDGSNHIVAIVLFGFDVNNTGETAPNNYVTTAFLKHIWLKGV